MKKKIDIIEAMHDQHLFGPLFKNPETWAAWRVFLKSLFALPMDNDELTLYRQCTGRETPPQKPFQEAWVPTGVRSGKSFIAALVAVFLGCFRDYRDHLAPGERAMILVIAADRAQAQVIFRYCKGFLAANRMMSRMVESERTEAIDLKNRVTITVATASYRSVRGFTCAAIVADEIAFWRSDDGANPASEVLRALRPRLATIPDSILLGISSPYMRSGPLWQAFKDHHGKDGSDVLCWKSDSRTMNPTISQALIDRDMAADPEASRAEWYGEFRSDLAEFLPIEALEAVVIPGRFELPPLAGVQYRHFVDPSGGRNDAATLAIGHRDQGRIILDLARRWPAPHDPAQVVAEQAELIKMYNGHRVTGDRYAGAWPEQEFSKAGIRYEASEKDRSALYLELLPLVLSGRVELLDVKHLVVELRSLERRTRSGGRDSVDHPPRGSDDLANAVAGCCALLGTRAEPGMLTWIRNLAQGARTADEGKATEHRIHFGPDGGTTTIIRRGGVPQNMNPEELQAWIRKNR